MVVTEEDKARFIPIIDSILLVADLQTITRGKIREGLELAIGRDLTEQKVLPSHLVGSFCRC